MKAIFFLNCEKKCLYKQIFCKKKVKLWREKCLKIVFEKKRCVQYSELPQAPPPNHHHHHGHYDHRAGAEYYYKIVQTNIKKGQHRTLFKIVKVAISNRKGCIICANKEGIQKRRTTQGTRLLPFWGWLVLYHIYLSNLNPKCSLVPNLGLLL